MTWLAEPGVWTDELIAAIERGVCARRATLVADARTRHRVVSWHRPPQHYHKRGYSVLMLLMNRVPRGTTTDADAGRVLRVWLRAMNAEGQLEHTVKAIQAWREERDFWHEQWRKSATDYVWLSMQFEDVKAERNALRERLDALQPKGCHDVMEFYPPNEEADDGPTDDG